MALGVLLAFVAFTVVFVIAFAVVGVALVRSGRLAARADEEADELRANAGGLRRRGQEWTASDQ